MITGGSGFIGKNLVEYLSKDYVVFAPNSKEQDISNYDKLAEYVDKNKIKIIIHCATYTKENEFIKLEKNLTMFFNIEKIAKQIEKVIYMGSGAEYDKRFDIEMAKESDFGKTIPTTAYGFSKYIANIVTRKSNNIYNMRLFGVFGKYEDYLRCFISNLCCKAVFDLPLSIRQNCMFDFLFIDDLLPIVNLFLNNPLKHHDYNIVTGKPISLISIANTILQTTKKDLPINILKEGLNLCYTADNSRLISEFPAVKFTDLKISVNKLYQYYNQKKDNLDYESLKNSR